MKKRTYQLIAIIISPIVIFVLLNYLSPIKFDANSVQGNKYLAIAAIFGILYWLVILIIAGFSLARIIRANFKIAVIIGVLIAFEIQIFTVVSLIQKYGYHRFSEKIPNPILLLNPGLIISYIIPVIIGWLIGNLVNKRTKKR
jgi:hypothetical protein